MDCKKKRPANKKNHAHSSAEIDLAFQADLFEHMHVCGQRMKLKLKEDPSGEVRRRVPDKIQPYGSLIKRSSAICSAGQTTGVKFQALTSELSPTP